MSQRYKGAVISATPPTVSATSPNNYGTAKGVWTLQQQMQYEGAGTWPSPFAPTYIEDVFITYIYTGNGSTQTITTGIDLAGKGGMLWIKNRSGVTNNIVNDTARGAGYNLMTNSTSEQFLNTDNVSAISSTGFSVGVDSNTNGTPGNLYASWTFRKAEKFFDVVTYTGNGASSRAISHNLGSAPGCIIVKSTSNAFDWKVYHRSEGSSKYLTLNKTLASATNTNVFAGIDPTASNFYVGPDIEVNGNGYTYVAYLFAHNAGGFGDSGSENVISCGSYTGNGSTDGPVINLGWEPQWILWKASSLSGEQWGIVDVMRNMPVGLNSGRLFPDLTNAEQQQTVFSPLSTGFQVISSAANINSSGATYIYIAIRRGPMKPPTSGTQVFSPNAYAGGTAGISFNLGFAPDALLTMRRNSYNFDILQSRLTGQNYLFTNSTSLENGGQSGIPSWNAPTGTINFSTASSVTGWNGSGSNYVIEAFKRAPGFMDVVCYTGTGSPRTVPHNLGVVPELMIIKSRSNTADGIAYSASTGNTKYLTLFNASTGSAAADVWSSAWNNTTPTSTVFTVGDGSNTNGSGWTLIAYLFASCPGVSKVGSYSGNGTSQVIDCGFANGSRFVIIKRVDASENWFVFDTARGISSGDDKILTLNNSDPEVTNRNNVSPATVGFEVNNDGGFCNASGGTYIYLAIA